MGYTETQLEEIDAISHDLIDEAVEFRGADWIDDPTTEALCRVLDSTHEDPSDRRSEILDVLEEDAWDRAEAVYRHRSPLLPLTGPDYSNEPGTPPGSGRRVR